MGTRTIYSDRTIYRDKSIFWDGPKKYEIIDNRMDKKMANKIIDISKSAFYDQRNAKDRSEYIKKRLDNLFPKIHWSVFIYTNGYCKVSFDKNYYICANVNGYYLIIFGYEKHNLFGLQTFNILIKNQIIFELNS